MQNPSLAIITSANPEKEKLVPTLQPSEYELGWLSSLIDVEAVQMGAECLVIPAQGTYGQGLIIPFPIRLPRTAQVTNHNPIQVSVKGKTIECRSTIPISETDVGKDALLIPVVNEKDGPLKYVIAGLIQ